MAAFALPALYALFVWWFSTAVIIVWASVCEILCWSAKAFASSFVFIVLSGSLLAPSL